MKLIVVSGPPSSGKTGVIIKAIKHLNASGQRCGVVKFDCLYTDDDREYQREGIPVKKGLSGSLCPDHYFVSNIEEVLQWGVAEDLSILVTESAGLCNRCSPYIREIMGICVIDNLSGINTPRKIGPMLKTADIVVITKGDIVSQAEREVFSSRVATVNPRAMVLNVNGLTGQGTYELATLIAQNDEQLTSLDGKKLRYPMPAALCSYCLGETRIGKQYQMGNVSKIKMSDLC